MRDQRLVMLGAGSAGVGVCEQIVRAMISDGLGDAQARSQIFLVDRTGLLTVNRQDLAPAQRRLAQPTAGVADRGPDCHSGLLEVVRAARPTALIGLSTATGAFTEGVARAMAAATPRPIIMPLSNPTSRSEASPQDLADWTNGQALIATGSPFPAVRYGSAQVPIAQCNNVYIFPGIGLAVTAIRATRVTDAMMTAAAVAVSESATIHNHRNGALLPDRSQLVETATAVARAVCRAAVNDGVAPRLGHDQIDAVIDATRWHPRY